LHLFSQGFTLCRPIFAPSGLGSETKSHEGATSISDGQRPSKKDDESTTKTVIKTKEIFYLKSRNRKSYGPIESQKIRAEFYFKRIYRTLNIAIKSKLLAVYLRTFNNFGKVKQRFGC